MGEYIPPVTSSQPAARWQIRAWGWASLGAGLLAFLLSFIFFVPVPTNICWFGLTTVVPVLGVVGWVVGYRQRDVPTVRLSQAGLGLTCAGVLVVVITTVVLLALLAFAGVNVAMGLAREALPALLEWIQGL